MARIKKREDGRYVVKISLADGKTKFFYGATQKEAKQKAADFRAALGLGMDAEQAGSTLQVLADNYLNVQTAKGVGAGWYKTVCSHIAHFGALLNTPAEDIKSKQLQSILNTLAEWHDSKAPLSHKTLSHILTTWRNVFELAIPEVIQYNPCKKVVLPARKKAEVREPLTDIQQAMVRDTPHRARRAAMLMLYSGLRRGEATALTWADVDFTRATITVSKSYDFVDHQQKGTKTAAGMRTVHVPSVLIDFLRTERTAENRSYVYVLHGANGAQLTETAWRRMWQSYMLDLNMKYGYRGEESKFATARRDESGQPRGRLPMLIQEFTPHQLRHTFCTMLYLAGVDVMTARDQVGHTDIKTTMNIYTHLDKKYKRSSMSKLDEYIKLSAGSQNHR